MSKHVNISATYSITVNYYNVELDGDETPEDVLSDLDFSTGSLDSVELLDWDVDG